MRFGILLILLLIPIQTHLTCSSKDWWDEEWYYRIPVRVSSASEPVEGILSLEINITNTLRKLEVDKEPDIGSIRLVYSSEQVPFAVSFSEEIVLEDFEGDLNNWEFSNYVVFEKSEDAVQGSYSLKFRKGTLKEAPIILRLDQKSLRSAKVISFFAKGNFTVVLRERLVKREISRVNVSSGEYRRFFIQYDPSLLSDRAEFSLFFYPSDHMTYNFIDDIKLARGNLIIRWFASISPGEEKLFYIYFNPLKDEPKFLPIFEVKGKEAELSPKIGPAEGFRTVVEVKEGSVLSGKVKVRAKVLGNLSKIVKVQFRLDYTEKVSWNSSYGLFGDMRFEEGEWVGVLDTTRTYDGLHKITVRAFELSGRFAEDEVFVYVRNVQYEEPVNLNPGDEEFTFCVLGDNRPGSSGEPMPQIFWQLTRAICTEHPDMVFNTGDVVYEGEFEEYLSFREVVSLLRAPLFIARGNHEISIGKEGEENYEHFFEAPGFPYNSYYSFNYGNSHFIILNANVYGSWYKVDEPQLNWFIKDLEENRGAEHVFIFIHQPIFEYKHGLEDKRSERILEEVIERNCFYPGRIFVFQGHEHMFYNGTSNNVTYYITGGGGAPLDPQYPDETLFFHFLKVTVRGKEVNVEVIKPLVLEVRQPESNVTFTSEQYLRISGRTQPYCKLKINGKEVPVLPAGVFDTRYKLDPGKNEILIEVYDPQTEEKASRRIIAYYRPALEVDLPNNLFSGSTIKIKVSSFGKPVKGATLMLDGVEALTDDFGCVEVKLPEFDERGRIVLVVKKEGFTDFVRVLEISARSYIRFSWFLLVLGVLSIAFIYLLVRTRGAFKPL